MGEPHATSPSGLHFDFQAVGEFIVSASRDGKHVIQTRQEPYIAGAAVTVTTAVAANVDGDRVGIYVKEPSLLLVNGRAVENVDSEQRLPHGGFVQRHGGSVKIRWRDGGRLTVTEVAKSLDYAFVPGPSAGQSLGGLLGKADGTAGKIASRNGEIIAYTDPDFVNKLYKQVGNSWRINGSESLFHYWSGESTAKFTDLNFPPKYVSVNSLSSADHAKAESICRAVGVRTEPLLDDCILDVGVTGMPAFAAASVGLRLPPVPVSPVAGSYGGSAPSTLAVDHFTINIGDTVSPGHPASGAGTISKPGQKQSYSFSGQAGQNIFVAGGPCDGATPNFEVREADDKILGGIAGCGGFGPITLPNTGAYRVAVTTLGSSARYNFTLRSTSFDRYSIKIGDAVSPDHPAQGAGIIKDLGQRQFYSFRGRAGENVFVGLGPCDGAQPSFVLLMPDNTLLADIIGSCNADLGRKTLPVTGTYRIVASTDKSNVSSRYNFFVHTVPPDHHFSVRLPLTVSLDVPGRGAGHVSAAGEQQFYDFSAAPGTIVHIQGNCGGVCPKLMIRATKTGDSSDYGFTDLNYTHDDWTLPPGGKYTIEVRSNRYVGKYSFTASQAEPQHR